MRALVPALSLLGLLAASLGLACVLGYRGATEFEAEYDLQDIDVVRFNLPDTPIAILGDPEASTLRLEGAWFSVGGSQAVTVDQATTPSLHFARDGRFAELSAVIPTATRDLVDLELASVVFPENRDLELWTGLGDVQIAQVEGNIAVDLEAGHVTIFGGAGGIAVRTGAGDLSIETLGNTTASTGRGDATIRQRGVGGNDLVITSDAGSIDVRLRSDANLDLDLEATGEIRVHTRTVSTVTHGSFQREVGNGRVKIWLRARGGGITVRLDESADG